jgi:hypothetical protein
MGEVPLKTQGVAAAERKRSILNEFALILVYVVDLVIYDSGEVTFLVEESKGIRHLRVLCPPPEEQEDRAA